MVGTSSKRSSKNLKLYIISSIYYNNKIPDDIKRNVAAYHLKPFLLAELIEKKGYGTWDFTEKGKRFIDVNKFKFSGLVTSIRSGKIKKKKVIRGHGFKWNLRLPKRAFYDIYKRKKILEISNKPIYELHNKTIKTIIRNHKVHLGLRGINIYFNKEWSYVGESAKESYREALFEFNKIIKDLEKCYGVSLRINNRYKFKLWGDHYGDLNNEFAIKANKEKQYVEVYDNNRLWLSMDFSDRRFIELETVENGRAKYDMDYIITPFMNKLHKEPKVLDRMEDELERVKNIFYEYQKIIADLVKDKHRSINFDRLKY